MDLIPLQADVYEFVQAGVSGFLLKDANTAEFFSTIRAVFNGEQVLPPNLTGSLFSQIIEYAIHEAKPAVIVESVSMTARERQVIGFVADGLTNKEVAQKMHISTFTVKSHLHNILEKLSLHSRVQVANFAHISGSNYKADKTSSVFNE
jgi:DNA-binding NarL/FixJ family response regulator